MKPPRGLGVRVRPQLVDAAPDDDLDEGLARGVSRDVAVVGDDNDSGVLRSSA